MLLSEINHTLTNQQINRLLFSIVDDQLNGDCILVFGSMRYFKSRVEKAVELYFQKRAPKILFSGLNNGEEDNNYIEALEMQKYALELGVKEEDILIDDQSTNTTENILCSLIVLERAFKLKNIKRLIIVTTDGHMTRVSLTLKHYMPKWIEYSYAGSVGNGVNVDNWSSSEIGCKKVYEEVNALIKYAKDNTVDDMNIDFIFEDKIS